MKATTLEQARELVKAGLDAKTADMSYLSEKFPKTPNTVGYTDMVKFMERKRINHFNETGVDAGEIAIAPCWTAEALLETIPQRIAHGRWDTGAPKWLNFTMEKHEDGKWSMEYRNETLGTVATAALEELVAYRDTLIECCVDFIVMLYRTKVLGDDEN